MPRSDGQKGRARGPRGSNRFEKRVERRTELRCEVGRTSHSQEPRRTMAYGAGETTIWVVQIGPVAELNQWEREIRTGTAFVRKSVVAIPRCEHEVWGRIRFAYGRDVPDPDEGSSINPVSYRRDERVCDLNVTQWTWREIDDDSELSRHDRRN